MTPFHNTAAFLGECIESVTGQSYSNFEYILVDNCSTDGSSEIAESYVRSDPRIRLIRRTSLLPQVRNYNEALAEISDASEDCKIVQADDFIFPDCLKLVVETFQRSKSIGLVSAYDLKANIVRGSGFPYRMSPIPGKEVAELYLRTGMFPFGSPTTVMYRSSIVRDQYPFFEESRLHEDTEKCMQILENWDFGFVYQVLSFLRADNESISSSVRHLQPDAIDRYIIVRRFAQRFFERPKAAAAEKYAKKEYYRKLALAGLRLRGRTFWSYHKSGLKTVGRPSMCRIWQVALRLPLCGRS